MKTAKILLLSLFSFLLSSCTIINICSEKDVHAVQKKKSKAAHENSTHAASTVKSESSFKHYPCPKPGEVGYAEGVPCF